MSVSVEKLAPPEDTLTLRLKINAFESSSTTKTSVPDQSYTISHTIFKFKVQVQEMSLFFWHTVYFQFGPSNPYIRQIIRVTSKALFIKNRTFQNNGNCALVYCRRGEGVFEIDIKIQVVQPFLNKNIDLYDDEAMTDFVLHADDGCVRFHRFALALSSPVLKTMLSGKWKETTQGVLEVPGISKNTIEQLKDFIYKSVVPDNVSLELLSLASYYMMTELEEICAEKLADSLTYENIWSILEYCAAHKLTKLLTAILNRQADKYHIFKAMYSELNE